MDVKTSRDRIYIRDLALRCTVGVYPEERREKQDVILNITLHVDLHKAGVSDCLDDTVDYKKIKRGIMALVDEMSPILIEHLAERVAALCLQESRVQCVEVIVDKPGALRFARSVAVHIVRTRSGDSL